MHVIIAGSRSITDHNVVIDAIEEFLDSGRKIEEIICGMAKGVDLIGKTYAEVMGVPVKEFPVDKSEGYLAGPPKRNQRMADYAKSTGKGALLLIWDGVSSGSLDMLKRAQKAGLTIMVIDLSQPRLF